MCLRKMCDPRVRFLIKERGKVPKFDELQEKITLNREFTSENIRVIF